MTSNIRIQEARYYDLPRIAHVLSQAFWDDNLFGDLIHPQREKFPKDMELYWLRRARINFWDYTWRWVVAVELDTSGNETVVGIAEWARLGEGGRSLQCAWYDPRKHINPKAQECFPHSSLAVQGNFLKPLSAAAMKAHALIWPNRAADPKDEDIIERVYPYLDHVWTGERSESWYLEFLAIHPSAQGQGIGRRLVQWGLDHAKEDGVCASVISARGKDPFYRKCGFDVHDGRAGMGVGNPLADVEGGNILWSMAKK